MRQIYSLLFLALLPFVVARLYFKGKALPAYRARIAERFARYGMPRPTCAPVWIHAVSVGECEAAFPLVRRLRQEQPDIPILMTCTTPTGSSRIQAVLGSTVAHVYLPYDLPRIARRFLLFFRPRIGIIMETELWPNLFLCAREFGIPLMIANGRLSSRSTRGYQRLSWLIKPVLAGVSGIAAQSQEDADRYIEIGAVPSRVMDAGNIKYDISWTQEQAEASQELRSSWFGSRPVIVAGSTHPGEEEQILHAFSTVRKSFSEALLILVPRHPERGLDVMSLCKASGYAVRLFSHSSGLSLDDDILVIDRVGELRRFYGAADLAYIGGTLIPHGGQNPLEPLVSRVPVIFGPSMSNFKEIRKRILDAKAGLEVRSSTELAEQIIRLLNSPVEASHMGERGEQMIHQNQGAVNRIYELTAELLKQSANRANRLN